jgi:hypothetical protein
VFRAPPFPAVSLKRRPKLLLFYFVILVFEHTSFEHISRVRFTIFFVHGYKTYNNSNDLKFNLNPLVHSSLLFFEPTQMLYKIILQLVVSISVYLRILLSICGFSVTSNKFHLEFSVPSRMILEDEVGDALKTCWMLLHFRELNMCMYFDQHNFIKVTSYLQTHE